jgi:hypothetical protein
MENRRFDHLLGWHPTANARQTALFYPDEQNNLSSSPLACGDLGAARKRRRAVHVQGCFLMRAGCADLGVREAGGKGSRPPAGHKGL